MELRELCKKRGYIWTPDLVRQYKFLQRSARIKNYDDSEIDRIISEVLRKNKYILTRKKSERLKLAMQSVEIVLKKQIQRKK